MKNFVALIIAYAIVISLFSQDAENKDKVIYKQVKNGFYQDSILKGIEEFKTKPTDDQAQNIISVDFYRKKLSHDAINNYKQYWHNPPLSQGRTGTCWSFASVSFLESEVYRLTGQKIKLSEMFFVYWEYVERAKYFIEKRGDIYFAEGSEANAVIKNLQLYGAVPASAYSGKLKGQKFHDHEAMEKELSSYLKLVKEQNAWNEEIVVSTVKKYPESLHW